MRKIVLAASIIGILPCLSGCGSGEKAPTPAANSSPTETSLSDADKAAVDALGSDLLKLADAVKNSTGAKQEYADHKLATLLTTATDAEAVDHVFDTLPPGSGYAKGAALSAKGRLKKP
jgi:hypothetical protein